MATFGNEGSAAPGVMASTNYQYASWFVMPTAGSVTKITAYIGSVNPGAQGCFMIYQYTPGSVLKGQTGSVTLGSAAKWQDFNFSTAVGLPAGSYAISAFSSGGIYLATSGTGTNGAVEAQAWPTPLSAWPGGATDFSVPWNLCFYATYTEAVATTYYNLTVASNPSYGGSVTGAGSYAEGTTANISATPNTGYAFSSWTGDLTGSANPDTIYMDADKAVSGNFVVAGSESRPAYQSNNRVSMTIRIGGI